jgi:hypothetical protein
MAAIVSPAAKRRLLTGALKSQARAKEDTRATRVLKDYEHLNLSFSRLTNM